MAVTVPYSQARYADGGSWRGIGDAYAAAKIGLIDRSAPGRHYGVAVLPVLEILSAPLPDESGSRLHWALPVAAEYRGEQYRVYGASGYFSRGAWFGGGALELPLRDCLVATATLTYSHSTREDALSDALNLG